MTRSLPPRPDLRFLQKEAKDLLKAHKSGAAQACAALRLLHRFGSAADREILDSKVTLQEVQLALALDYGFRNWFELTAAVKPRPSIDRAAQLILDKERIRQSILTYRRDYGGFPARLEDLHMEVPADAYSPTSAPYHYEAQRVRCILSSCGKDGVYGTDDDEIFVWGYSGWSNGPRRTMYPLPEVAGGPDQREQVEWPWPWPPQAGRSRPTGDSSVSGKLIDDRTGEPVARARVLLVRNNDFHPFSITPALDGSFEFRDIPDGSYRLQVDFAGGYQDFEYNPEHKPGKHVPFTLKAKEQLRGLVFRLEKSHRITGRVFGEDGQPLKGLGETPESDLCVVAWLEDSSPTRRPDRRWRFQWEQGAQLREDGTYLLDRLDGRPVRVALIDWRAEQQDDPYPHSYAPGTFSRDEARLVVFDEKQVVEGVDIAARKKGGLVLEGAVLSADTGKPVPEALVVVKHRDMRDDRVTAYTDAQGRYRIECLGSGGFLAHVDATPDGFERMTQAFSLGKGDSPTRLDLSVKRGVTISGNFIDESGKEIAPVVSNTWGWASIPARPSQKSASYSIPINRRASKTIGQRNALLSSHEGEDFETAPMAFPSYRSFLIEGMPPGGETRLSCRPETKGVEVRRILYQGKDVRESGFPTKAGDRIEGISIVLSQPAASGA